jgi:hypothetical protein
MQALVKREERLGTSRTQIFRLMWDSAEAGPFPEETPRAARATIPYLTEPWYC